LGTSIKISFVSNESCLETWDYYCGGREELIAKVKERYGVDIAPYYSEPIYVILKKLKSGEIWKSKYGNGSYSRKYWLDIFKLGKN
jgi:hypothetical protein